MIGSRKAVGGQDLASEGTKAALHPIANDGATNLLGDCETDPHPRILVLAVQNEQDEAGRGGAQAAIRGKEVSALLDRG
jgi:hypothetical protein